MQKKINFVTNVSLLSEIWKSKLSYCEVFDDRYLEPDVITDDLATVTEPNLTIRLDTEEHIDLAEIDEEKKPKGKLGHLDGVSFKPFRIYRSRRDESGKIVFDETARSHSKDGAFRNDHGRLTAKFSMQLIEIVEKYSRRSNWRGYSYIDEMVGEALVNLLANVLKFDEARSQNPFAYISTLVSNSFKRQLKTEKQQSKIRDILLVEAGSQGSMSSQLEGLNYSQGPAPERR